MTVKLLTEHHLEFVSLKGGCTGSSESTLVKMPHCWKSHVMAHTLLSHFIDQTVHYLFHIYMGLDASKPVFGGLRTTKAQISLHICAD